MTLATLLWVVRVLFGYYFGDLVDFVWLPGCFRLILLLFNVALLRFGFAWLFLVSASGFGLILDCFVLLCLVFA